jgi:asparagine synthase (glutamine-hydrolysing)
VTVALSGDGGDENFAGYRRYARAQQLHERLDHGLLRLAQPLLRLAAGALPVGAPGQAYAGFLGAGELGRYHRLMTYERSETLRHLLSSDLRGSVGAPGPAGFARLAAELGAPDYVSTLQLIDIHTYLPEDILTKVDRASMAVSLESRVPLLDHVLMEYAATIPSSLKLRAGQGKHILKRAMASSLPGDILSRRKMGFGVPLGDWFRGELRELVRDVLLSQAARERGMFRPEAIARLLDAHDAGRRDYSARLWALVCLELWMGQWLDARVPAAGQAA